MGSARGTAKGRPCPVAARKEGVDRGVLSVRVAERGRRRRSRTRSFAAFGSSANRRGHASSRWVADCRHRCGAGLRRGDRADPTSVWSPAPGPAAGGPERKGGKRWQVRLTSITDCVRRPGRNRTPNGPLADVLQRIRRRTRRTVVAAVTVVTVMGALVAVWAVHRQGSERSPVMVGVANDPLHVRDVTVHRTTTGGHVARPLAEEQVVARGEVDGELWRLKAQPFENGIICRELSGGGCGSILTDEAPLGGRSSESPATSRVLVSCSERSSSRPRR